MPNTQIINPEVIELIRHSTADALKEGRAGVERQHTINVAAAAHHGLRIRRTIEAVDVSGRHVAHDPQFIGLFAELPDATLLGVLVSEQSRIFRPESFEDYAILEHFARNKKLIFTPTGVIDPCTTEGRMSLVMNGMMSGEELRKIRERTVSGKEELRKQGRDVGGPHMLPRGVRFVKVRDVNDRIISTRWEYDGVDSERVRRAYEFLFAGLSFQEIARRIGGGWTGNGIRRAMRNPIWKGIRRYAFAATGPEVPVKGKPGKFKRLLEPRKTPLDVVIDLPAIITEEAWDRAQEIIAERAAIHRKSKLKNTGRPRFLCNGVARCKCGAVMYGKYGSRKTATDRYVCSRNCGAGSVRRTELDGTVAALVVEQLLAADFLLGVLRAALENAATIDPTRKAREAKLARLDLGRANLLGSMSDGEITRAEFKERLAANEAERRSLEAMLPAPKPQADPAVLCERIAETFAGFGMLTGDEQRGILQAGLKEITVDCSARTVPTVTLNGGYLGGVNSELPSTTPSQIDSVPDVAVRFPQPIEINSEAVARRAAQKAATAARKATPEAKEARRAYKRERGNKATANPAVYQKKLATLNAWKRARRAALKADPAAYAEFLAKAAAEQRALRARRRAA